MLHSLVSSWLFTEAELLGSLRVTCVSWFPIHLNSGEEISKVVKVF